MEVYDWKGFTINRIPEAYLEDGLIGSLDIVSKSHLHTSHLIGTINNSELNSFSLSCTISKRDTQSIYFLVMTTTHV